MPPKKRKLQGKNSKGVKHGSSVKNPPEVFDDEFI